MAMKSEPGTMSVLDRELGHTFFAWELLRQGVMGRPDLDFDQKMILVLAALHASMEACRIEMQANGADETQWRFNSDSCRKLGLEYLEKQTSMVKVER